MASNSSTLYNGLFIVNGNVLMGNNVASAGPLDYPAGSTRLFYSGDDFLDTKGQYYTGTHLQLKAQGVKTASGGVAQGGSIFLEGGREKGGINTHGSIQFLTGGFEAMRVASNGYVGINVSTPMYSLDVKGTTNISQLLTVSSIYTTGTIVSGTFLSANLGGILTFGDITGRNISGTNIRARGTISAAGNITSDGTISAAGNITSDGTISGSNMVLRANMKSFNINTDGSMTSGSNVVATNDVIAFGKFIGDGSGLTNTGGVVNQVGPSYSPGGDTNHVAFNLYMPIQEGAYAVYVRNPAGNSWIYYIGVSFTTNGTMYFEMRREVGNKNLASELVLANGTRSGLLADRVIVLSPGPTDLKFSIDNYFYSGGLGDTTQYKASYKRIG